MRIYYEQRKANCKRCIFSLLHKSCIRCKTNQFESFVPILPQDYLSLIVYKHPYPGSFSSVNPSLWNHKPIQLLSWGKAYWKVDPSTRRIQEHLPLPLNSVTPLPPPDEGLLDAISQNQWAFMDTKKRYVEDWYPQFHQALWEWLAENPTKSKIDWPLWEQLDGLELLPPFNTTNCFACFYAGPGVKCENCPLDWRVSPSPINDCLATNTIFYDYLTAHKEGHVRTVAKLARKIAKMPWNMKTGLFPNEDQNKSTGGK